MFAEGRMDDKRMVLIGHLLEWWRCRLLELRRQGAIDKAQAIARCARELQELVERSWYDNYSRRSK